MTVCVYSTNPCSGFKFNVSKLSKITPSAVDGEIVSLHKASGNPSMKNTNGGANDKYFIPVVNGLRLHTVYAALDRKHLA